jgi:hypothetical protein
MYYLSSVYSVTIHVSGVLVAHHQEVTIYICDRWFVLYVLVGFITCMHRTIFSEGITLIMWK